MSRSFVRFWSNFFVVIGAGLLAYLFYQVPPRQSDGTLDGLAIGLFFVAFLLFLFGAATLAALALHRRWPTLAGIQVANAQPPNPAPSTVPSGNVALRQGFLTSLSLCAIILFTMLGILDSIFVFVVFLIAGLIEVYFQNLGK